MSASGSFDALLRRVYGRSWERAPSALTRAVAAVVISNLLALTLTVVALLVSGESWTVTAAVMALLTLVILLDLALAALLLRGSRVVWALFVAVHASALALTPDDAWDVPGYVASAVVLVLLLLPPTVRGVWRHRPSRYAPTYDGMQRPD